MAFYRSDNRLDKLTQQVLENAWNQFPSLAHHQIALTWLIYDFPVIVNTGGAISAEEFWKHPVRGSSYRSFELIYPASLVKLFYLVALHEWLSGGMVPESGELNRAMRDMIRDSSNDATSLVVDVLTGTTSGPELPPAPFQTWKQQRNIINRYFQSLKWLELEGTNLNQKPWSDGPYGRERAFLGELMDNRNILTTDAVARLLHSIVGGIAVSSERSQSIMELLQRNASLKTLAPDEEENQIAGFIGEGLPEGSKLWSKAGWTSQVRHDAAYIEIPDKQPYLLVIFTEGRENAQNSEILPFLSQAFAAAIDQIY
jgi:hypothetical protein